MILPVVITMWVVCLSAGMVMDISVYMPVLSAVILLQSIPLAGSEGAAVEAWMTGPGASIIDDDGASLVLCDESILSCVYISLAIT